MKKPFGMLVLVVTFCVAFTIISRGSSKIAAVNGKDVSASKVAATINNAVFANQLGIDMKIPTVEEATKEIVLQLLLEDEFVIHGIVLSDDEHEYVDNYLNDFFVMTQEAIDRGGSEKENAEQVLKTMKDYLEAANITQEEYAQGLKADLIFQIKYKKLLEQKYRGNEDVLKSDMERQYTKIESTTTAPDTSETPSNEISSAHNAITQSLPSSISDMPLPTDLKEAISKEYAAKLSQKTKEHSVSSDLYYKGEKILELYSLDVERKIYIPVFENSDIEDIVFNLDSYEGPYRDNVVNGFFIVTETGKHDIRPSGNSERAKNIIEFSKNCNSSDFGYAQWLIYMSISNMESISYIGPTGRVLNDATYSVKLDSQQPSTMEKIGLYLKNIRVLSLGGTVNAFVHPLASLADGYLEIVFKTGVKYTVIISSVGMTVYSSDLDYTLLYECDKNDILDFFDFVISLEPSTVELVG